MCGAIVVNLEYYVIVGIPETRLHNLDGVQVFAIKLEICSSGSGRTISPSVTQRTLNCPLPVLTT